MNRLILSALALASFISTASPVRADNAADLATSLNAVGEAFHDRYALADYKKLVFGWEIDSEIQTLVTQANQNPNLSKSDAQVLLNQFFVSARDYHAQAILGSATILEVPIGIHSADQRVFITNVKASGSSSNIAVGDEVLTYDGAPVWDAITALLPTPENNARTDLRDAERKLTTRYGMLVEPLPTSPTLALTLRNQSGATYNATLTWGPTTAAKVGKDLLPKSRIPKSLRGAMDDPFGYITRKSYLPKPKTVTWEAPDTDYYYAWIGVLDSGQRVGMIRIPSFAVDDFGIAIVEFKKLVERMNSETDTMILDVQGNRGGLLDYAYAITSFFIEKTGEDDDFLLSLK